MSEKIPERKYDKAKWGDGPWRTEPDRVQGQFAGYAYLIIRSYMGNLCGYVGVPKDHPDFGKSYNDIEVSVHGGLTYADKCNESICHVPESGMPDEVWWLGFDCAHGFDLIPSLTNLLPRRARLMPSPFTTSYRDIHYVTSQCERLATQLRERANGKSS